MNINMAYATWRWNQRFSSKGRNLTFGRIHLIIVRHTGSRMRVPSIERTSPAPLDIHTENLRVFKGASWGVANCLYLKACQWVLDLTYMASPAVERGLSYHPKANMPQCNPQNKMWNIILLGVNCFFTKVPRLISEPPILPIGTPTSLPVLNPN